MSCLEVNGFWLRIISSWHFCWNFCPWSDKCWMLIFLTDVVNFVHHSYYRKFRSFQIFLCTNLFLNKYCKQTRCHKPIWRCKLTNLLSQLNLKWKIMQVLVLSCGQRPSSSWAGIELKKIDCFGQFLNSNYVLSWFISMLWSILGHRNSSKSFITG